jgi:hypothetical protein
MLEHILIGKRTIAEWRAAFQTTHRSRFARLIDQAKSYLTDLPPIQYPRETIICIGMAFASLSLAVLLTDARWLVAGFQGEGLRYFAAGAATPVWIGSKLRFASAEPVALEMDTTTWQMKQCE